ncbi:hypothetical protein I6E68_09220 [Salinibacterium sp. NSLL150]|uniref:baeRF11 domain-containing protein n=1 Tax=unclassified Salinibacterium TaxID=2632331 RepID=UPI0018CDFF0C|nr:MULTISPECIES: hypothetical protein [unclassified Salinibacterium]MBH0099318.1 hypothetical protein [Salinibacterium sp. NSLL35]MBH0102072.1 hypothetical protein [Salinibacterium sp. NSLL150]MBH0104832.1 hypothetical protein [Salinibacterium sp. NSLL16]MBH0107592.1 hypothetical protein [Salinibacterium sp. NSLL17]
MSIDIPSHEDLVALSQQRNEASVSLYVSPGSTDGGPPIGRDTEAARLALRSAATEAMAELGVLGVEKAELDAIGQSLGALDHDTGFWASSARSVAVFVSPEITQSFRLRNELPTLVAVGDRFDLGPLLRATTFGHSGYVLAVTLGSVRLLSLNADDSSDEIALPDLPEDLGRTLETADNHGKADTPRADGALGSKVELRRYCSLIQEAVLSVMGNSGLPLVLAASSDLKPAYREISTYRGLLSSAIDANPSSLSIDDLEDRGRAILAEHHTDELASWRTKFGNKQSNGLASSQLSDVSHAAAAGLVDTLLFDLASTDEGSIDEYGQIVFASEPGPSTYGLVDELAARVLRTGGTVKAVRSDDLPDDSPVAATFRGPL